MISLTKLFHRFVDRIGRAPTETIDRDAAARAAALTRVIARDNELRIIRESWISNARDDGDVWTPVFALPSVAGYHTGYHHGYQDEQESYCDQTSFRVNPANGMPLIDGSMIDVTGQIFGFCENTVINSADTMN